MDNFIGLLSSRSRLFHLKPINVGTYLSESLTSYIARLAEAHCMTTGELIAKEMTPILKKPYLTNIAADGGTRFYENASMLNGIGNAARDFVEALEELTLCSDLHHLTMMLLSNVIPDRNLCRNKKAWCPFCLKEWKDNNQTIYEPLLWALQPVSVCIDHGVLLQEYCPSCNQTIPILERRSKPGHCSKCRCWLGTTVSDVLIINSDELSYIIAQEIAKTIAEFPTISIDIKPNTIRNFIETCINHTTGGNIAEYSRILCKPKSTVWGWVKGKNLPPIESLAHICKISGVSVMDIFSGEPLVFKEVFVSRPSSDENQKQERRKLDKEFLQQQLNEILSDIENTPLPLKETARRLNVDTKILKSYFPELCEVIIQKNRDYQRQQAEERLDLAKKKITQTVLRLYSIGIYPSRRAVENAMPYRAALRRKNIQSVWKALVSTN
ncbi:TniQ family protein [Pelosinus sp. UFO1]|uniref:TniQ family protein n=1 Tax=Pelosinus sp. UFO1 TaxID=484770 RepID=UPI0004D1264B|nr:TniQ family protein [Pelosinus sp. UFO1]AIF53541.1 TniQ family protein [Pelosinus sp. UFO1]